MGRNIFRRSALVIALTGTAVLPVFPAAEAIISPRSDHSTTPVTVVASSGKGASSPRRNHETIRAWSVPIPSHTLIDQYIDYFDSGKGYDYLVRCLDRAQPYMHFISLRLAEKGMPPELVYLPLVESAFRVDAISRSGASGLWQFMMNSIDPYDITVDAWRDDRRDFWRATEAALDKLQYNYKKTGDWNLALAAYNCGLGKVTRTMKSSGISDYWELCDKGLLPRETRHYVPKLAAVTWLCRTRRLSGLPLEWDPPVQWVRIPLDQSVDIYRIARMASIPEDMMKNAHGELNYRVTPPARNTYYLKVPSRYSAKVEEVLAGETELMQFKRYRVQSGDTLSEIAEWYGISVRFLQEYNPEVRSRYLRIGQILLIPVVDDSIPDRPGYQPADPSGAWTGRYTVREGDSLWKIALLHDTSPENIAAGNGLPLETVIMPGMSLKVPRPGE